MGFPATTTIRAIAHALPATVLSHEEVAARFGEKDAAAIAKMSGVRERRVVAPGQTASDLALAAARRLLAGCDVDPRSIDLLTFASQTPDYRIPATASVVHGRLGLAEGCCTMDVGQACSSFLQNWATAHSMLVAGVARRALVLNADALTTLIHPRDRSLVPLHGDAGVAALVEPSSPERGGVEFFEFGTDGTKFDRLIVPAGGARTPGTAETRQEVMDGAGSVRTAEHLYMDGAAVFHFCVYKVTDFLKGLLARRSLAIERYDKVLLHQANKTMVDLVYRGIGASPAQRSYYLEKVGNSSGAALPALLAEAWRAGEIKPGSRTLLCAFGGGLSWGAASIRWPDDADAAVPGDLDVAFHAGRPS